jgi:hypothetical protein
VTDQTTKRLLELGKSWAPHIKRKRIPLRLIAPLACGRPDDVRRYITMLKDGLQAPEIWLEKLPRGRRYRYRIFDGAHSTRAARRAGRKTIKARILVS